eukprot:gene12376-16602_t
MQSLLKLSNTIIYDESNAGPTNGNNSKEIRSMIANVAHDLKTPLAGLSSAIELMELSILDSNDEILSDTSGKSASNESDASTKIMTLSGILSNMKHMNSSVYMTINRFLDSSKAVNGIKLVPNYECVHINDTIMAAVGWIRSHSIVTQTNIKETVSKLKKGSEKQLVSISNLIDISGDTRMESYDKDQPFLLIEVSDNGIGISQENASILFEPKNQSNRNTGGTGLSLFSFGKRLE